MPRVAEPASRIVTQSKRKLHRVTQVGILFAVFAFPLFLIHLPLLRLPYFWDEHGQFIPTALDILRHGWWVARSTVPNVHPPGVEAYLVAWYRLFGYSIAITRVAMLGMASAGLLATFLLAIELSKRANGAPAFWPPLLLLVSPLFYTQSFMAQLDMPAMVFSVVALLLFVREKYRAAAAACVVLVLMKETGLVTPFVFCTLLVARRRWKETLLFAAPAIALGLWLLILHRATGYWLGDPGFAHYNVEYQLNPVRMAISFLRRIYYLFVAEFRWIGTVATVYALHRTSVFRNREWVIAGVVGAANVILVSVLGGAELERYLLPVLPIFYIATAVALTTVARPTAILASTALLAGLCVNIFWKPPYPFPYENNFAMVDFVRLEQIAGKFADRNLDGKKIATAWPYTSALRDPDYGFVQHPHQVLETNDFHRASVAALPPSSYDALITYTRTWAPQTGVVRVPFFRDLLSKFYQWEPDVSAEDCARLGLRRSLSWTSGGQTVTIYTRN
ncbi:MAG: hypothetical protein JO061_01205 [Acidobacteriaceae bacterium]|nr:hypothetical protein [Acidobacteriaceae bacterium]